MKKATFGYTKAELDATPKEDFAGPDESFPIRKQKDVKSAWDLAGHADDPDAVRSNIKEIAKRKGWEDELPDTADMGADDMSMSNISSALSAALGTDPDGDGDEDWPWIVDVFPGQNRFVYCCDGQYYEQGYSISDGGDVKLIGSAAQVKAVTSYEPVQVGAFEIIEFGSASAGLVPWSGKVFECGFYPAQKVDARQPAYLDSLVSNFDRMKLKDTHTQDPKQSVFFGKLGYADKLWREGKELCASGFMPEPVKALLGSDPVKVSIEIIRETKTPVGLAMLNFPQVDDAAIQASFAAFGLGADFAGARHSQADKDKIQAIHDHACALGADCGTAAMGARHSKDDQADIQNMHDLAVKQGATCEGDEAAQMGRNRHSRPAQAPTQTAKEKPMKPETLAFFAKNPEARKEAGISDAEFAELQRAAGAATTTLDPVIEARFSHMQTQLDARNAHTLSIAAAEFARDVIERQRKAHSSERESLESQYKLAVQADGKGIATFGTDGAPVEGEAVKLLRNGIKCRRTLSLFETKIPDAGGDEGKLRSPIAPVRSMIDAVNRGAK